ncbi:MAG: hypothetical protein ACFE8E_11910 [Candidatus Hodarchaeota archaeon]
MERRLISFTTLTIILLVLCILGAVLLPMISILFLWFFIILEGFVAWRLVFGFGYSTFRYHYATAYETEHPKDPTAPLFKYRYVFLVIWVVLMIVMGIIVVFVLI